MSQSSHRNTFKYLFVLIIWVSSLFISAWIPGTDVIVRPDPFPFSDRYPVRISLSKNQNIDIINQLGIDIIRVSADGKTVEAAVDSNESSRLEKAGFNVTVIPNETNEAYQMYGPGTKGSNGWPTYAQFVTRMQTIANNYSAITRLVPIGQTVQGRTIYCLHITDSPDIQEDEPEVKYSSTIHGNEPVGAEMTMRLAELLTSEYSVTPEITNLVNELDTWLCPIHNPDGYEAGTRYNANGDDLNRSFPDPISDPNDSLEGREIENQAFMQLGYDHHFVMGINYHTGAAVVNYPLDHVAAYSPDDSLFYANSIGYASRNSYIMNGGFTDGVTIGWEWYIVNGGFQDWSYMYRGEHHVTVELSDDFYPAYSLMNSHWAQNEDAMIWWMEQALRGVRGIVTDSQTGQPLAATITVAGNSKTVQTDPVVGDYHRLLLPGAYTVGASARCYVTSEASVTVPDGNAVVQNFALQPEIPTSVHGVVTDAETGLPLAAHIEVVGINLSTDTNPTTGEYALSVCAGDTIKVSAGGYQTVEWTVSLSGNLEEDFALQPRPGLLLVKDDGTKNYGSYYEAALNTLAEPFESWDTSSKGSPTAADLAGYEEVIWFTGDDSSTSLTTGEQNALAQFLSEGGRLFISGQEIGYDINSSSFYSTYLHAQYISDDTNVYGLTGKDFLTGTTINIQGGDGANNQTYPDEIQPAAGAVSVFDYDGSVKDGGVAFANDTYRMVYFSFGFEAINNAAHRRDVMGSILEYFREGTPTADLSISFTDGTTNVHTGDDLTYTLILLNSGPDNAEGVTLRSDLDSQLTNIAWTCSSSGTACSQPSGNGAPELVLTVASAEQVTLQITCHVPPEARRIIHSEGKVIVPETIRDPDSTDHLVPDEDVVIFNAGFLPVLIH